MQASPATVGCLYGYTKRTQRVVHLVRQWSTRSYFYPWYSTTEPLKRDSVVSVLRTSVPERGINVKHNAPWRAGLGTSRHLFQPETAFHHPPETQATPA